MNIREIKLSIASGVENEDVKSIFSFFDDLFNGIEIYTKYDDTYLIFMKNGKYIMHQELKDSCLCFDYDLVKYIFYTKYQSTYQEMIDVIRYMVIDFYSIDFSRIEWVSHSDLVYFNLCLQNGLLKLYNK